MTDSIKTVCIYCGGQNTQLAPHFIKATQDVGAILAQNNYALVYGGGGYGLMGKVADAALGARGKVIGVIPEHLRVRELQHNGLSELHIVPSMHIRKQKMADLSDAFVILPGGYGTLDEMFEIITWRQLGLHNKPIILFNHQGFWNPLIALIDHMIAEKFIPATNQMNHQTSKMKIVQNSAELLHTLQNPNL